MLLRPLDIHMEKNEIEPVSHTVCKNKVKIDPRSTCKR